MALRVLVLSMDERLPILREAANILNNQPHIANKMWSSSLIFGDVLTTSHPKNWPCYKKDTYASGLD
jgi:hypothetical protein